MDRIGEGTYGVVYRAFDRTTGGVVALKRCLPHHELSDGFPLTTLREITILNDLMRKGGRDHGIVALRDVTVSSSRSGVFLVFDHAPHDLASIIDKHHHHHRLKCHSGSSSSSASSSPFTPSEVKRLMLQLLDALHFLHTHHILHRDLKLSNLLYDDTVGRLIVADFGLARRVGPEYVGGSKRESGGRGDDQDWNKYHHRRRRREEGQGVATEGGGNKGDDDCDNGDDDDRHLSLSSTTCLLTPNVVSLWYRPPELLFGAEKYNCRIDIWGAGCVMGELLTGRPVMDGRTELDQISKMFSFLGPPNSNDWPELAELPLLKSGEVTIPQRWQINNDGLHLLDVFRNWNSPTGTRLLMGLLMYNPSTRLTAEGALASDYFTTAPPPTPLSLMPTFPTTHDKAKAVS